MPNMTAVDFAYRLLCAYNLAYSVTVATEEGGPRSRCTDPALAEGRNRFAAPRAGDQALAAAFERVFSNQGWCFEFQNDIVPHVPPADGFWCVLREAFTGIATALTPTGPRRSTRSPANRNAR